VSADFFSNAEIHMRCIEILKISVSWIAWHRGMRSPGWLISSEAMPKGCVNSNLASGMLVIIYKSLSRIIGPAEGDGDKEKFDPFVAAMLSGADLKSIKEKWPEHNSGGVATAPTSFH
ncbi:hypothetical protein, partial [Bacillus altitudinis]|uniref:hypothetical protein n=1 Tax=Bacillus altitudinis TaxID=293387 RepID=UPI00366EC9DD